MSALWSYSPFEEICGWSEDGVYKGWTLDCLCLLVLLAVLLAPELDIPLFQGLYFSLLDDHIHQTQHCLVFSLHVQQVNDLPAALHLNIISLIRTNIFNKSSLFDCGEEDAVVLHLHHWFPIMSIHTLSPLWLLSELEAKLRNDLLDLFPREFDLNFIRLLTVVIEEWANVDPETSLS